MRFRMSIPAVWALLAAFLLAPATWAQPRRNPAGPRAGRPSGPGARLGPGPAIMDRLERMTPEERRRVLDRLPPERKKLVEERLRQFNQLPPEERARLRQSLDRFGRLPPEQQEAARKLFSRFNRLPEDRRKLLAGEFRGLRQMAEAGRRARISSDEFRSRYTQAEQQLLQDLSKLAAAPGP